MTEKKSIGAFLGNLLHNNNFLKILSVFLALFVWAYILYIGNPVNETVFDKIEVDLAFEGSAPDRNGYMYLMTDPNLTVSVTVSGSRSELINVSKEDIKASLNMDAVISEGTYNINVSVSTGNKHVTVTDVYPKSFTIEFASEATREIPVQLLASGVLPSGYEVDGQTVSPETITVTGPAKTLDTISKAYITVPLTNAKENISGAFDVSLVTESGENVDRRYLTLSDASVEALLNVYYRKSLTPTVEIINPHGCYNEDSLFTVSLDTQKIKATGAEQILAGLDRLTIGSVDTSQITRNTTITLPIPQIEGVTFDTEEVTATVSLEKNLTTKTLTFNTANITCINVPTGKVARLDAGRITVRIRGKYDEIQKLNTETLKCQVDVSEPREDGTYPLILIPTTSVSEIAFDVVGSYFTKVNIQ